jgi:hypothetical protein
MKIDGEAGLETTWQQLAALNTSRAHDGIDVTQSSILLLPRTDGLASTPITFNNLLGEAWLQFGESSEMFYPIPKKIYSNYSMHILHVYRH